MSNKANWTGAIAAVIAAGAAVAALFLPFENSQSIEETKLVTSHPEVQKIESPTEYAGLDQEETHDAVCQEKFNLIFESTKSLSLPLYQDEEYKSIVEKALAESCYNEAFLATSHLSLDLYKDTAFKKIYLFAIEQSEFKVAKKAINMLSLSIYQDDGNKALLKALRNKT